MKTNHKKIIFAASIITAIGAAHFYLGKLINNDNITRPEGTTSISGSPATRLVMYRFLNKKGELVSNNRIYSADDGNELEIDAGTDQCIKVERTENISDTLSYNMIIAEACETVIPAAYANVRAVSVDLGNGKKQCSYPSPNAAKVGLTKGNEVPVGVPCWASFKGFVATPTAVSQTQTSTLALASLNNRLLLEPAVMRRV